MPFVGSTFAEIHACQRTLPAEQLKAAKVPARIVGVLNRMLAFDPVTRPQSARTARPAASRPKTPWGRVGRCGGGTGRPPPAAAADKPSIAAQPFENLSPGEADAFFAAGVQDEVTNDLDYVATLNVVSANSTRSYLPGNRDLPKIGQELDARYLLEGSVRREGDQIGIDVRLTDLHEPNRPWSARYTRQVGEVFAVQGEIVRAVTKHLRATLPDHEKATIDRPPTTSLAARLNRRARSWNGCFCSALPTGWR